MREGDNYYNLDHQRNPWQQQQQYPMESQYQQGAPPPQQQQQQHDYYNAPPNGGYPQQPTYGAPPPYSYNPPQPNDEKYSFDEAFKIEKPRYNDWWAGLLLIGVFIGFIVISAITIRSYATTGNTGNGIYGGSNNFSLDANTIILFAFVLVVAFVLSWLYVLVARLFPKQFIWVTGILNVCWALGTAIFYLYRRYWSAGIVFLIFACFTAFAFWTWIPRIPFSALMLKTTISVSKRYGHVYLVSVIGGFVATALAAWFSVTLVAIYVKYEPSQNNPECRSGNCSRAKVIGLIVYVTFAMYWISEWVKNTIHTTISGVYGSWYFAVHNFPRGATRGAAKRALTYSFGSISLGSLLVAIVQFLRQLCSVAQSQAGDSGGIGGIIGYILFCILGCFISLLEWALQFLNRYAFSHIALYGKPYIPAAKDTWHMIRDRGIDALVNECLIGPVLSFGSMAVAFACALLSYLYLLFTKPAYNSDGTFTAVIMAFSFLIGFQIALIFTTPLSSGIDTIFVGAGWDPQVMINDHPELYQEMVHLYPKVQQAIQVRR
ncbi:hypothetical protein CDD82_1540 [Ophiocordyceps australis]|uniref:Protein PNS1 n=1 Tax=Ophiocordyceps australis TaxID=1399860 RepID=A0A2C5XYJ0_9HYPO|nr:hypothetical protein CDD82_1540 [Ophiocordyceps australis]